MKIAVVGSGVSGLAATWLLNEHSDHQVHLYEADSRPGGHAHTVRYTPKRSGPSTGANGVDVDTGFIVFNPTTYPNFLRFLCQNDSTRHLVVPTEMTFSVSRDRGAFEWAGKNLRTVFCQIRNLLEPDMWRLVWDVARFNACAGRVLALEQEGEMSINEYLNREGYSQSFRDNYLIPMTAAIWSTPPDKCAVEFPARALIQFLHNHHLLQITGKPSWLTIKGGSIAYINRILSTLPKSQLYLSTRVESVTTLPALATSILYDGHPNRTPDASEVSQVRLKTANGASQTYDHVILACHSDEAMRILRAGGLGEIGEEERREGGITKEEEEILGAFEWNRNEAVLHSDVKLMPKSRLAWSCWNYLTRSMIEENGRRKPNVDVVSLTYGMNDLQSIPESVYGPVLVTLNPPFEPREDLIAGRWNYDHPVLNGKAVRAQEQMHKIQGTRSISYAGAYLRYGFHEDGFTSGLVAAASLDGSPISASRARAQDGEPSSVVSTVRPPFPIEYADLEAEQTALVFLLGGFFDIVETSGLRALVGLAGGLVLALLRWGMEIWGSTAFCSPDGGDGPNGGCIIEKKAD